MVAAINFLDRYRFVWANTVGYEFLEGLKMKCNILFALYFSLILFGCATPQLSDQKVKSLETISVQLDDYFTQGFAKEEKEGLLSSAGKELIRFAEAGKVNEDNREKWLKLVVRAYKLANRVGSGLKNPHYFPQENRTRCVHFSVVMKDMLSTVDYFATRQSCKIRNMQRAIDEFNASIPEYTQYIRKFYDLAKTEDQKEIMFYLKHNLISYPEIRDVFLQELDLSQSFKINNSNL